MRSGVWPRPHVSFAEWLGQRTTPVGDCVVWTADVSTDGQPIAKWQGRSAVVRRLVWEHHHGLVTDRQYVTATRDCAEPMLCVADHHSRLLAPQQAATERAAAGRVAHGEDHGHAKLTEPQARAILASPESHTQLARRYHISPSTVQAIKSGRRWKHLHQP